MGVACVTPKPLCSLTETHYNVWRHHVPYDDPTIAAFARYFGRRMHRLAERNRALLGPLFARLPQPLVAP